MSVLARIFFKNLQNIFAAGTESGKVLSWTQNGKLIQSWQAHTNSGVHSIKINKDLVLSGGADDVCVYSLQSKKAQLFCWNQTEITALQWIDLDNFIAGSFSGQITLDKIDLNSFRDLSEYDEQDLIPFTEPLKSQNFHSGGIYQISICGDFCASCSVDCSIVIWNWKTDQKRTLNGHFGYVIQVLWLQGNRLASASHDGSVKIWDTDKSECLLTLQEGLGAVNSISSTQSGHFLASGGQDGNVYFWNVKTGDLVTKYEEDGRIMHVGFNNSNNKIVITSYGSVTLLELSYYKNK